MKKYTICLFVGTSALFASCNKAESTNNLQSKSGGETTVFLANSHAFSTPSPNLSNESLQKHLLGDVAFEATFVSKPSEKSGGVGPVFNNNSCVSCHPADGRAAFPEKVNEMSGFFFKISVPGVDEHGGPKSVPGYGTQMQHQANFGVTAEAKMNVAYEDVPVKYADGTVVILQKPVYSIVDPYTSLPADVRISPRIGMPVFGLGLLEAIPEDAILALADANDADKDSVSGRPNYVWDPVSKSIQLGRFGWKAGTPSVLVQTAGAYNEDMGVTNPLKPIESSFGQTNGDNGVYDTTEIQMETLENVTFYVKTLGVPAMRNVDDPKVVQGNKIFTDIGCAACHNPGFVTGVDMDAAEISNQKIYPYTDMLLHDMGDGLADNREEFEANGNEWKTRPLWGIGLTPVVNGHSSFLHDGRARSIEEAILWHGGEANASMLAFLQLSKTDRDAVLAFLNSL